MTLIYRVAARVPFLLPLAALLCGACGTGSETDTGRSETETERNSASTATNSAGTAGAGTATSPSGQPAAAADPGTPQATTAPRATDTAPREPERGTPEPEKAAPPAGMTPPVGMTPPAEDMGTPEPDQDPASPDLGAGPSLGVAARFAVFASSTVTCTNSSAVSGDVGVSPGTAIAGFAPSCTLTGALHAKDAIAAAAHADLSIAFDSLAAPVCEHDLTGQDLGGQRLEPGVYCFDTTAGVTGELTLDAGGDAQGVWIFQVGTALTTATGSSLVMAGGGDGCNVFWRIGSSATLGTNSSFQGNLLAAASITLTSGSSLVGRALALTAAVTSDANNVSLECAP